MRCAGHRVGSGCRTSAAGSRAGRSGTSWWIRHMTLSIGKYCAGTSLGIRGAAASVMAAPGCVVVTDVFGCERGLSESGRRTATLIPNYSSVPTSVTLHPRPRPAAARFCDVRCSMDVAVLVGVSDYVENRLEGVASRVLIIQLVRDEFGCLAAELREHMAPQPLHAGDRLHIRIAMTISQSFSTRSAPLSQLRTAAAAQDVAGNTLQHRAPIGARR
jgi:hypothetical protein